MTILITGASGSLGSQLKQLFFDALIPSHDELDITNKEQLEKFFMKNKIDLIIHTAAMTSVRKCEKEKKLSWEININGTKNLINNLTKINPHGKFVYVSTACVFDGHLGMYDESSIPYPENFYALTKLLAEQEVKKFPNYLILRTNFVAKKKWPYPKAFSDRYGTYLFAEDVAKGIKDVIDSNQNGIIHIVGDKKISMFDLAKIVSPNIEPMTITDYSGPKLTMDMSLDSIKWKKYKISFY